MKKLIVTLFAAALVVGTLATTAAAAQIEVEGDAYAGIYSKYLWRGFDLDNLSGDKDKISIQGGTDLTFGGFTVGFWGNMSENTGNLNEVDVVLDYTADIGEVASISVGNILYNIDGAKDTNEVYLALGLNVPLSPTATVYYDYDEFDTAMYMTLGLGHDIEVSEQLGLSVGATASYAIDDPKTASATNEEWFHNLELSAGASFAVTEQISVDASFLYSAPLSEKARRNAGIREEYTAGGGVTLAF